MPMKVSHYVIMTRNQPFYYLAQTITGIDWKCASSNATKFYNKEDVLSVFYTTKNISVEKHCVETVYHLPTEGE